MTNVWIYTRQLLLLRINLANANLYLFAIFFLVFCNATRLRFCLQMSCRKEKAFKNKTKNGNV